MTYMHFFLSNAPQTRLKSLKSYAWRYIFRVSEQSVDVQNKGQTGMYHGQNRTNKDGQTNIRVTTYVKITKAGLVQVR